MEQEIQREIDLSNVKYLISDWDGTLVDSNKPYTESFASLLHSKFKIDKNVLVEFYKGSLGSSLSYHIREALKKFADFDIDDTLPLEKEFWNSLTGLKPKILPGAKEGLRELKQKGIRITVWSGTRSDILLRHINELSLSSLVDFSIGNVPGSKDLVKGSGLFKIIADHFKITTSELAANCLVIGDGRGDIEAGRAVGAIVGGIGDDEENPILKKADFTFKSLPELAAKFR